MEGVKGKKRPLPRLSLESPANTPTLYRHLPAGRENEGQVKDQGQRFMEWKVKVTYKGQDVPFEDSIIHSVLFFKIEFACPRFLQSI